jgi:hypothetical protein
MYRVTIDVTIGGARPHRTVLTIKAPTLGKAQDRALRRCENAIQLLGIEAPWALDIREAMLVPA